MLSSKTTLATLALTALMGGGCGSSTQTTADTAASTTAPTEIAETTTSAAPTTSSTPATTAVSIATAAPSTTEDEDTTFEETIVDETEAFSDSIDDLFERTSTEDLPREERVIAILQFVGTGILTETAEGRCLVDAVDTLSDAGLEELEDLDAVPSPAVLASIGEATRSCDVLRHIAATFQAGMVSSGGTEEWVDVSCAESRLGQDDGTALFTVTGNSSAMELPDYVDSKNTFVLYFVSVGECLRYGHVTDSAAPIPLAASSIECMDTWGQTDSRVLRLFAGNMGEDEFDAALHECLTPEELAAAGW